MRGMDICVNFPCLFRQNAHTICNYFSPASGILKNKIGDTIKIELGINTTDSVSLYLASRIVEYDEKGNIIDATVISHHQSYRQENNRLYYDYRVCSSKVKSLYVMYNQKYLVAYRLEVEPGKD